MNIKVIDEDFSICKITDIKQVDFEGNYYFVSKTDEELSLVCNTKCVPENALEHDDDWKAFRIQGQLDFSLVGILSKISTLMAKNEIGIFAVSTFNTDYVLTKAESFDKAIKLLQEYGYTIIK